jgi:hypothetical protein
MKYSGTVISKAGAITRGGFLFIFIGLLALSGCATNPAEHAQIHDKAMFLYRFGQFVEWPAPAFASSKSPMIIGVLDADPLERELQKIVRNKNLNGHPLAVCRGTPSNLTQCRILFVGDTEKKQLPEIFSALGTAPVLTVGEKDDFLENGGMINFVLENGRVRFDVAPAAAQKAGLKMSSQLLMMARRTVPL